MAETIVVNEDFVKVGKYDIKQNGRFWSIWSQFKTQYMCLEHCFSKKEAISRCKDWILKDY